MKDRKIINETKYPIVKSNDLIQKTKFDLTVSEQKIILRLIQLIKPTDKKFTEYEFSLSDYCQLCNIGISGKNYSNIKRSIDNLSNKSFWITIDGITTQCRWINKAKINTETGKISLRLDDDLFPYLIDLKKNFTVYSLYSVIGMRSKYSMRLYELLKSYQFKTLIEFSVDELKHLLSAEKYNLFGSLKQKVIDVAVNEINNMSDIVVSYITKKERQKIVSVSFKIREKTAIEQLKILENRKEKTNE